MLEHNVETEFNGHTYRIGKLSAFEQFHVSRRLMPILAVMGVEALKAKFGQDQKVSFALIAGPVSEIVAKMSDEDVDRIINACLSVVRRRQDDGKMWAPVMSPNAGLMFHDLDMMGMLRLTVEVIKFNLGSFFPMAQDEASSAAQ